MKESSICKRKTIYRTDISRELSEEELLQSIEANNQRHIPSPFYTRPSCFYMENKGNIPNRQTHRTKASPNKLHSISRHIEGLNQRQSEHIYINNNKPQRTPLIWNLQNTALIAAIIGDQSPLGTQVMLTHIDNENSLFPTSQDDDISYDNSPINIQIHLAKTQSVTQEPGMPQISPPSFIRCISESIMESNINDSMHSPNSDQKSRGMRNWSKLRETVRAVMLFKQPQVKEISVQEIEHEVDKYTLPILVAEKQELKENIGPGALGKYDTIERLFKHLAQGSKADIKVINKILISDPSYNLFSKRDSHNILNQPNTLGFRPLYTACKHGNELVVNYLLDKEANPYLKSDLSPKETESNLEVATRWKHSKVVSILLERGDWGLGEVRKARKLAENGEIAQMLEERIRVLKKLGKGAKYACCKV